MPRNRITIRLSRKPQSPPVTFNGFVACPPALLRGVSEEQRRLYQWALEQAAAVVRPSITQRIQVDLLN